jgi:hypothetical protein
MFSWSDTARAAFGSCLPCLPSPRHDDNDDRDHSVRRDELESLLQSADFTDAEMDADALSLHSHIGQQGGRKRVKRKRTKNKGSISLFGFDLFGRPLPDPEAEGEDGEQDGRSRISRISSSTLDSDAAPLADDAIAQLSTQTQSRQEEEEERRARKRLRKQQKTTALLNAQDDAFEGFQGSGALAPARDEFGAFQQAPHIEGNDVMDPEFVHIEGGGADEAYGDADADFDAGSYVRTAAPRSDSGSGTRSRTSASNTESRPHRVPLPPSSGGSRSPSSPGPGPNPNPRSKPQRSKKSGKRSTTTASSTTTSQPRSPTSAAPAPHVDIASHEGFPQDAAFEGVPQDGEGFPAAQPFKRGLKLTGESVHGDQERTFPSPGLSSTRGFPSPGLGGGFPSPGLGGGGFPSPGLGRSGGFPSPGLGGRKNSLSMGGQGAFLARTGEDP